MPPRVGVVTIGDACEKRLVTERVELATSESSCYGSEHLPKSPKTDFGFELYKEAFVQELARAVRLRQKLRESDEN